MIRSQLTQAINLTQKLIILKKSERLFCNPIRFDYLDFFYSLLFSINTIILQSKTIPKRYDFVKISYAITNRMFLEYFCLNSCLFELLQLMAETRQKVTLMDNLPKIPADRQIAQLRAIYDNQADAKEKIQKYIPIEKQQKYEKNFLLFDRNNDGILDFQELKEFLISIGQMINEEDLRDFYKQLARQKQIGEGVIEEGINLNDTYLIVLKKMREDDIEQQLNEAFHIVSQHKQKDKESGFLESDFLKEFLMTMGYKWGEDQADQFIKEFQPKSQKRIYPNEVVKKLIKR